LVLNKSDLVSLEAQQEWETRLHSWGYQPYFVSVRADRGLTALQQQLSNQITVVSGPSGVGKSSLINRLIPQAKLRTNAVSGKLARGRHTTRHVELFELPLGGLLADTPGFNQPELNCSPSELAHFFPEARQRLEENRCQFNNCLHREEPNCVVRGDWERYNQYLTFLSETIARQQALEQMGDAESTTKMKFKGDGQFITEPKLASKKYRRPSRRTEKQALRDLCRDVEEFTED
jgi:ribosome biogenesis GTPase